MSHRQSARTATRRSIIRAGIAVVGAVPIGVLVYQSLTFLSSSAAWQGPAAAPQPNGVTVFDDHSPSVVNLDADLLEALRRAATDAAAAGVEFVVNSGWRSP